MLSLMYHLRGSSVCSVWHHYFTVLKKVTSSVLFPYLVVKLYHYISNHVVFLEHSMFLLRLLTSSGTDINWHEVICCRKYAFFNSLYFCYQELNMIRVGLSVGENIRRNCVSIILYISFFNALRMISLSPNFISQHRLLRGKFAIGYDRYFQDGLERS